MITYEDFLKIGNGLEKITKRSLDLYQNYKIDLLEFEEEHHRIMEMLLNYMFNKEQKEWFDWFCYENDFGEKGLEATETVDGLCKPICYDWESLYEYLKTLEDEK